MWNVEVDVGDLFYMIKCRDLGSGDPAEACDWRPLSSILSAVVLCHSSEAASQDRLPDA